MLFKQSKWKWAWALVAVCCIYPGRGRQANAANPMPADAALEPLIDPAAPYSGYGTVAILDDGSLVITMGGEVRFDEDDAGGAPGSYRVIPSPSITVVFQLETSGLTLAQCRDDEVFLDRGGAEIARRELSPDQVTKTSFRRGGAPEVSSYRYALMSLSGDMRVALDMSGGPSTLDITDDRTGRMFGMTAFMAVPGSDPDISVKRVDKMESGAKPESRIILWPTPSKAKSTCQIECVHGSCQISCESGGCEAHCSSGSPECHCVMVAP